MANSEQERVNRFWAIRSCVEIMVHLTGAWTRLFLTYTDIEDDAKHYGRVGLTAPAISRWVRSFDEKTGEVKPGVQNILTDENLLWLCKRYGIDVKLEVSALDTKRSQKELMKEVEKFNPFDIYK